jgi:hypothetical protein
MPSRPLAFAAILLAGLICAGQALAQSCREEVGEEEAQTYVEYCLEVSPATHPPCNADNSCELIWDEIYRGCDLLGNDAPAFCDE